jgi:hypothetical protein
MVEVTGSPLEWEAPPEASARLLAESFAAGASLPGSFATAQEFQDLWLALVPNTSPMIAARF